MSIKEGKMFVDDIVNSSYKCLKAIRRSESLHDYPEISLRFLEEADAYLNILRQNSPLMYAIIRPEYLTALKFYDVGIKVKGKNVKE